MARFICTPDEKLLALPDLTDCDEAVDAWTEYLVGNVELNAVLASNKQVRQMTYLVSKRENEKLLLKGHLREILRPIVERIAKLPPTYYFGW